MKHVKGERRKPTARQQLERMAREIPDQAAFDAFIASVSPELQAPMYRELAPLVSFTARAEMVNEL